MGVSTTWQGWRFSNNPLSGKEDEGRKEGENGRSEFEFGKVHCMFESEKESYQMFFVRFLSVQPFAPFTTVFVWVQTILDFLMSRPIWCMNVPMGDIL